MAREYMMPDQRKRVVLDFISTLTDGARPEELAAKFDLSTLYAAVLLSRYRKHGILVKRVCEDGKCRYLLSPKGERKRAYLSEEG